MRPLPIRSLAIAAFVCLTGGPLSTQSAQPPAPSQLPPFRAGASLVRVDVYPTRGGVPVLDLKAEDFEVREDGAAQAVESFEHVIVRPAGPQEERIEVSSQRESLQAAQNPRNRVVVIFLDTPNVTVEGAHKVNEPLIRLLDKILGPDDLVGVMTPAMAASQVVLGRKTMVIEDSLRRNWPWGTRFSILLDDREEAYHACYPPTREEGKQGKQYSDVAMEMIVRRRERATLEALQDLVRYLHAIREERKAVITITEGWLRMRQHPGLLKLREDREAGWTERPPTLDPVGVTRHGTLSARDDRNNRGTLTKGECDVDRMQLAHMDNDQFMRDIYAEANRGNVSFYPVDPRGLPVFDTPIGPPQFALPILTDQAHLKTRIESLHELALNTDGMAVVNSNDLDRGLKRIADDLTSYYLLGYYSTNTKADGKFRNISVRVKRPGVDIRARKGYRAPTPEELTSARKAADPPAPGAASSSAFSAALGSLGRIRPEARLTINAGTSGFVPGVLWIAGEVQRAANGPDDTALGGSVDIEASSEGASASTRVVLKPGERTFLTPIKIPNAKGEAAVRVRLTPEGGSPFTDAITVPLGPTVVQPVLYRRGPTTGNRQLPAGAFRFSRTERLRLEIPVGSAEKPGAGRLLDRNGAAIPITVAVGERSDAESSQRWVTADITLAPLAPGDYIVELTIPGGATEQQILTAIRVTR